MGESLALPRAMYMPEVPVLAPYGVSSSPNK